MTQEISINLIAKQVQDTFDGIYAQTTSFVQNPNSAIHGMIVSGDAGTGKTYTVQKALIDTGHKKNVEYIKGGMISAAALYVKLWANRAKHRIIVLDDCDIIHNTSRNIIVPMLLGACDTVSGAREVAWDTVKKNPLMEQLNVPGSFDFQGSIIWITNEKRDAIAKCIPTFANALFSRFNMVQCYFTDVQKYEYTIHLINDLGMLNGNCKAHKGGYPADVIEEALDYLSANYTRLVEVTPRQAIKIADTLHYQKDPTLRMNMLQTLWK